MIIVKELKNVGFRWDEEQKLLSVTDKEHSIVNLTRIEFFSLVRFCLRVAQKHWRMKKNEKKE